MRFLKGFSIFLAGFTKKTRFPARAVGDPHRPRDFSRPWRSAPRGPESRLVRREKSRIGHGGEGPPADAGNLTRPPKCMTSSTLWRHSVYRHRVNGAGSWEVVLWATCASPHFQLSNRSIHFCQLSTKRSRSDRTMTPYRKVEIAKNTMGTNK